MSIQLGNAILIITTVIGFGLAIWQAIRAEQLNRRQRDLDWPRFRSAVSDLARSIERSGFLPDFIMALSDRGAMVGHLVARELRNQVPIVTLGYLDSTEKTLDIPGFTAFRGTKATVYVPEKLENMSSLKVLLLDDFTMSGDGLGRIKERLLEVGFEPGNIVSGTVVATKIAIANKKGPDHYARETRDFDFYFPWGRAE